jgi:Flp pilus assembly protein TadD
MLSRLLLVALLPLCLWARADDAPDWADSYQNAAQMLRDGNIIAAESAFQSLSNKNPTDPHLANAIGAALNGAGKQDEAVTWYKQAIKLNPGFAPAYDNLGLNYASRGLFEQATVPLRKACKLDPRNATAFYNLGLVQTQLYRYSDAVAALERAHELSAELPDPLVRLAYANFRAGRVSPGKAAVAALLKMPGNRQAHVLDAMKMLNSVGRYEDTLRVMRDSGIDASTPEIRLHQAEALLGLRRSGEVVSLLEGKPTCEVNNSCLLLGSAQALEGDLPHAVATLQAAVRFDPANPDGYYRLGLVFLAGYRDAEALETIQTGLRSNPNSPLLLNAYATVLDVLTKRKEAVQALEKSVEIDAGQEGAWGQLGDLYAQLGEAEKALAAYARAQRLGASAESYSNYLDYLIRLERWEDAQRIASYGLARYPGSADLHYEFGKLQQRRGNLVKAEKELRRAISLHLSDASVHYLLAGVLQKLGRTEEAAAEFRLTKETKTEERNRKVLRARLIPASDPSGRLNGPGGPG